MQITRKGVTTEIEGVQPSVGEKAPLFNLVDLDDNTVSLESFKGEPVLISVFPDIDTSVCDMQTRRFFNLVNDLEGVNILNVSNNSKESLSSWCATNGLDVYMLRDTDGSFGKDYGLWMPEFEVLARSIFVIDKDGVLTYEEIVPEMASEPDYDKAIAAAKSL